MDRRLSFDGVAETYERARPQYPPAHVDRLFELLASPEPRILEVGPGTGQATGALLERGAWVMAVELGPRLAAFLRDKFAGHPRLDVVNTSFEDLDVEPQSFDAVVAATSYHWIDKRAQVRRPLEVVRPGGWLALINVIHVESEADHGYFDRVQPIYEYFDGGRPSAWMPFTHETVEPPVAARLRESGRFASVTVHRIRWDQTYTSVEYRDLLWSYSGTQIMAEPERSDMVAQLVAVVDDEFEGVVTRPLSATLTLAQVPGGT